MSLWNNISSIGIQNNYDDKLIKKIMLSNQFSFVASIVFFLSGINNYLIGDTFSALIIEFFTLICLSAFILNKWQYHQFAISFLLIAISIAIFYFDSYSGLASGTYLYHFPLVLAIAFIFDPKEKTLMMTHFLLPILFIIINVSTNYELFKSEYLTDQNRYRMFMFNLPFSASSIGIFIYMTISNNTRQNRLYEQRIKERNEAAQTIQKALAEKEILLAEIHHRVKNNLAIISSLLNLRENTIENIEAKNVLNDSKNRVKSMALIHDRLYKNDSLTNIDFKSYIEDLTREISYSYPTISSLVTIESTISNIQLNVNNAIPCGLILNELLTNCYKHAFNGRGSGIIWISFDSDGLNYTLRVKDNGVGIKDDYTQSDSLGMVVVQSLSDQLKGKHSFTVNNGTSFELQFQQRNA